MNETSEHRLPSELTSAPRAARGWRDLPLPETSRLWLLAVGLLAVFVARTLLAVAEVGVPYTFQLFDALTALGAIVVLSGGNRLLRRGDVAVALLLGLQIGAGMLVATLYSPYPLFGVVRGATGQALARGVLTALAVLGGLVIMRQGGPVTLHLAHGAWRQAGVGILVGLAVGLPLAALNVLTLRLTSGQPIAWQPADAALLDALQPAVVEEVVYRFALWGLLWRLLRSSRPDRTAWPAGILATLVHNFAHFGDLFRQAPLTALGMGAGLALIWGVPALILARRRGLEAAIAFHWVQDVARFGAGF